MTTIHQKQCLRTLVNKLNSIVLLLLISYSRSAALLLLLVPPSCLGQLLFTVTQQNLQNSAKQSQYFSQATDQNTNVKATRGCQLLSAVYARLKEFCQPCSLENAILHEREFANSSTINCKRQYTCSELCVLACCSVTLKSIEVNTGK